MAKVDLVNPLMGTRSDRDYSRGSTLPLVQRPWAMTAWCPVTSDAPQTFHPDTPRLRGIRATSQSRSDGMFGPGDQGFTLCPQTGPLILDARSRASAYRLGASLVAPHRLTTEFLRYRVAVDLAPTERCAVVRLTYGEARARLIWEGEGAQWEWDPATSELRGHTPSDDGTPGGFLVVTFDHPGVRCGVEGGQAWVEFDGGRGLVIEARVATSRLGYNEARVSRDRELGTSSLEAVAEEGTLAWERLLGRLEVAGPQDQLTTFYSCLYRCLCVPRKAHEWDQGGRAVHRHPTGGAAPGVCTEDPGLSTSYRTLYPLYALAYRDELPALLEGWANAALVHPGRYPELASVFAEAVSKGVPGDPLVWDALTKARDEDQGEHPVSSTLARNYFDWCLAQWGHTLGHGASARALDDASRGWQNLFDLSMGFFRPKGPDGAWTEGFSPLAWKTAFAEGSAWQGGGSVPHDPEGLIAALGGARWPWPGSTPCSPSNRCTRPRARRSRG